MGDAFVCFVGNVFPVDLAEDAVRAHGPHSSLRILLEGTKEEEYEVLGDVLANIWRIIPYFVDEGMVIGRMEWAFPVQHLVEDAAHSVHIALEVDGAPALETLRCKVERRA